ncbi:hypothetical protein HK104_010745 [Borealophlyctis nickersoniae]|nr:hypothetical protein HK104_010745 [Borealophlyctis nickersoniae]
MFRSLLTRVGLSSPQKEVSKSIFPSAAFLSQVYSSNQAWLSQCLSSPLTHRPTNTNIHILGVSLLNAPLSADSPHKSNTIEALHSLPHRPSKILLDQPLDPVTLNNYSTHLASHTTTTQLDDLDAWITWAESHRDELVEDIGVPEEWVDAFMATGLIPAWDVVSVVKEPGVEWIGMSAAEERVQVDTYLAEKAAYDLHEAIAKAEGVEAGQEVETSGEAQAPTGTADPHSLQKSLRRLFVRAGIQSEDLTRMRTGSSLADTKLQNLPLGPDDLAGYHRIVASHLLGMGVVERGSAGKSEAARRWERSEAGRVVRHKHLADEISRVCEEMGETGEGQTVLAVMDRNHVDGVRRVWAEEQQ